MGGNLKSTSGPVLERAGDLAAMLTNLKKVMSFLLTKSIVYLLSLKRFFIQQWKTINWIS
jgi:hypothetical protein